MALWQSRIKAYIEQYQSYFRERQDDIKQRNVLVLKNACIASFILYFLYTIVTIFLFRSVALTLSYLIFSILQAFLLLLVWKFSRDGKMTYHITEALCLLFIGLIMAFILVISIFPFPDNPAIFFSIFYIFMSILFILPPAKILGLLTAYEVAFIILAFHYKTKEVLAYDIFSSLTTWFIALILFFVFLGLHLRESRMRQLLEITSQQDTVSGLANRFAFETYITKTYHTCCNTKQSLAIFMIDIDDFKIYNDTYGHIAGDTCLHTLCGSLKQYADNENFFIARFGGEEIVAVVVDQQVEQLKHYAEGLLTAVRDCGIPASFSSTGKVTISIGVAIATEPQYTLRVSLIEQADHALYEAKRRGKDQYIIYPWL